VTASLEQRLQELARLYGAETAYYDTSGQHSQASTESLLAVLQALGCPVQGLESVTSALRERRHALWQRPLDPVAVCWDGGPASLELRLPVLAAEANLTGHLILETGERPSWQWRASELPVLRSQEVEGATYVVRQVTVPGGLPWGYHRLTIELPGGVAESLLVSAPRKSYLPGEGPKRMWGVFLPLYALHTRRSWGSGDFSDLKALTQWVQSSGGGVVATLPLLAAFLDEPFEPSPYMPASRLMWNEFYVDVTAVPEMLRCSSAQTILASASLRKETDSLRRAPLVDYRRQMALKRQVLEELCCCLHSEPTERLNDLRRFAEAHPVVEDYARFRATCEKRRTAWRAWPEALRQGDLRDGDCDDAAKGYHLYAQWLAEEQLQALADESRQKGLRLYFDLPLGVHPDSYDVWREQAVFASGACAGAPPDSFFSKGQNWGFPPLHPERLREEGYRYYIASLRHQLRHAGIVRIDHVMSFHRLYWIPAGLDAAQGAYVRYRPEEFYAIIALESHRNRTMVVGEDLGTVPPQVRPAMAEHDLQRMYVVQYELRSDSQTALRPVEADTVASLNTHDMPTFAAFWQGRDIQERREMGLLDGVGVADEARRRQTLRESLVSFLQSGGWLEDNSTTDLQGVLKAILSFLGASAGRVLLVNLEDLWLETEPQNVPGTQAERPNWRRKTRHSLETLSQLSEVVELLREVDAMRRTPPESKERKGDIVRGTSVVKSGSERADSVVTLLSDDDVHLFNEGTHCRLYAKLGAHTLSADGADGTYFAVWAPNAESVSVTGDFNGWNQCSHPLRSRGTSGIWEGFIPNVREGALYKYHVVSRYGDHRVNKADPFGLWSEVSPETASVVWNLDYSWGDQEWMQERRRRMALDAPMAVYEVHLGSWMRVPEEGNRPLTYRELAPKLAEYVRQMNFTHVEFLPVMEHPFYGSWGYQVTGYFAPTSRYGTPQDFMYLVDYLHQQGIGVILDWVPSHFPNDEHGLGFFDGTHLYEHADPRKGFHPDWTSFIFNYGRHEVRSFLLSSALFWLEYYHVDGLRVDAVASMLYLDYARKEGEWLPNSYGGRENLEAIAFLRHFNEEVYRNYPDVQTIAEESTAWPMVSRPTYVGGLGFGLKWDMGWMHDTLEYMGRNPVFRKYHHNSLTFRMLYAFHENFTLPLSHDEVVHGKGSLLSKMPGDAWQKSANLRVLLGYMYAQPGKKLLFMGCEFGQLREWNHDDSLDWYLLGYPLHAGLQKWVEDLNRFYRSEPALWEVDFAPPGFEWVDCSDVEHSVVSLIRRDRSGRSVILAVCNFTPLPRLSYSVGAPRGGFWREVLNSDAKEYGGSGHGNLGGLEASPSPHHGRPYSLELTLPPLGAVFFKSESG